MVEFSIILGVLGLLGTAAGMPYLGTWVSNWRPQQYWLVGLMALFPAWLIAFLGLLPLSVGPEYNPLPRSALLSSVVALLGVVFADTAVRRLDKAGYSLSPFKHWILERQGSFRRGLSLCGFSFEQPLHMEGPASGARRSRRAVLQSRCSVVRALGLHRLERLQTAGSGHSSSESDCGPPRRTRLAPAHRYFGLVLKALSSGADIWLLGGRWTSPGVTSHSRTHHHSQRRCRCRFRHAQTSRAFHSLCQKNCAPSSKHVTYSGLFKTSFDALIEPKSAYVWFLRRISADF